MKVYLATSGEYSDYRVRRVFTRREDAEAYELADGVEEVEVDEGPVEVRTKHYLTWSSWIPDREADGWAAANPSVTTDREDYDGRPSLGHRWREESLGWTLSVHGWDLGAVRKVYSEQRAQFIAKQDMGIVE